MSDSVYPTPRSSAAAGELMGLAATLQRPTVSATLLGSTANRALLVPRRSIIPIAELLFIHAATIAAQLAALERSLTVAVNAALSQGSSDPRVEGRDTVMLLSLPAHWPCCCSWTTRPLGMARDRRSRRSLVCGVDMRHVRRNETYRRVLVFVLFIDIIYLLKNWGACNATIQFRTSRVVLFIQFRARAGVLRLQVAGSCGQWLHRTWRSHCFKRDA